jgi:hypothetical protein
MKVALLQAQPRLLSCVSLLPNACSTDEVVSLLVEAAPWRGMQALPPANVAR